MARIQIFPYIDTKSDRENSGLSVDEETFELFWNDRKIVTEQKLSLPTFVNWAIIATGAATAVLALAEVYRLFKQCL